MGTRSRAQEQEAKRKEQNKIAQRRHRETKKRELLAMRETNRKLEHELKRLKAAARATNGPDNVDKHPPSEPLEIWSRPAEQHDGVVNDMSISQPMIMGNDFSTSLHESQAICASPVTLCSQPSAIDPQVLACNDRSHSPEPESLALAQNWDFPECDVGQETLPQSAPLPDLAVNSNDLFWKLQAGMWYQKASELMQSAANYNVEAARQSMLAADLVMAGSTNNPFDFRYMAGCDNFGAAPADMQALLA